MVKNKVSGKKKPKIKELDQIGNVSKFTELPSKRSSSSYSSSSPVAPSAPGSLQECSYDRDEACSVTLTSFDDKKDDMNKLNGSVYCSKSCDKRPELSVCDFPALEAEPVALDKVVPRKRFDDVVKKNGVGLTRACMAMSSATDGPADGTNLTGTGEIRLMPDVSTLREIPWKTQEMMVLADMHLKPGEAWEYCPREALRRVSKVLKDEFDLAMNAGFENEFYLLKKLQRDGKEELVPIDSTPYCSSSGFDAISTLFQEIVAALNSLNIGVEQLHAEAGKGQYEMAMGHTACASAADDLIFTRETIRAIASKHGLLATFVPKYALDDMGSGCHVHLSLWQNGQNVFLASDASSTHGMSKLGEEFMAGVLDHLPSILAFIAPLPNSYDRIQPNTWSGAYHCWGKENREAPIRTACPPGIPNGLVSNFEIKSFDGCANPHLGLAAIIAAGIDGLRRHLHLPQPIEENPATFERELPRLPTSLSESLEALRKDNVLKELIGEKLFVAIIGVRKAEIEYYSKNKEAYKQLIHRY